MANKNNLQHFRIKLTLKPASNFHQLKILCGNKYLTVGIKTIQPSEVQRYIFINMIYEFLCHVQGDQKVSVHLMITIQKSYNKCSKCPHQPPDIY
jgi:hypothetical protein